MVVNCHHVACVCSDRMKIPILKKKLRLGYFFHNWGKVI